MPWYRMTGAREHLGETQETSLFVLTETKCGKALRVLNTSNISEILREGRSSRRLKNLKFTERTRGKSAASMFGRKQLREAILHCVVNEEER